jgi:hypothetical protein
MSGRKLTRIKVAAHGKVILRRYGAIAWAEREEAERVTWPRQILSLARSPSGQGTIFNQSQDERVSQMNHSMPYASPRITVRRQMLLTAVSLAAAGGLLAVPARGAQLVEVDEKPLAEAYRASKLIGASVANEKDEKIGSVDDLIITRPIACCSPSFR